MDAQGFWDNVDVRGPDDCWEWQAYRTTGDRQLIINGQPRTAHRIAYILTYDEPLGDLFVLHTCDNPGCVNPAHLFLG